MIRISLAAMLLMMVLPYSAEADGADTYTIDPAHTDVSFKISHLGLARILGRFNDVAGNFVIDPANPSASSFMMTIKVDSIDTNQKQRDEHLRSPEFFDVARFAEISFQSTSVKPVTGGLEVSGDFTLHGVTRPLTMRLLGGGSAEFPPGVQRTGYTTDLIIRRSDYGMITYPGVVGDDVALSISFEGVKNK